MQTVNLLLSSIRGRLGHSFNYRQTIQAAVLYLWFLRHFCGKYEVSGDNLSLSCSDLDTVGNLYNYFSVVWLTLITVWTIILFKNNKNTARAGYRYSIEHLWHTFSSMHDGLIRIIIITLSLVREKKVELLKKKWNYKLNRTMQRLHVNCKV